MGCCVVAQACIWWNRRVAGGCRCGAAPVEADAATRRDVLENWVRTARSNECAFGRVYGWLVGMRVSSGDAGDDYPQGPKLKAPVLLGEVARAAAVLGGRLPSG